MSRTFRRATRLGVAFLFCGTAIGSSPSEWETNVDVLCARSRVAPESVQACRDDAAYRIARRITTAPTRRYEDLAEIPERFLLPEERLRLMELTAAPQEPAPSSITYDERSGTHAERIIRGNDVRWLRPAWSAAYCTYADMSADARKLSDRAIGAARVRDYARSMKTIAAHLRTHGTTPLPCRDPATVEVRRCLNNDAGCSNDVMGVVALVPPVYP